LLVASNHRQGGHHGHYDYGAVLGGARVYHNVAYRQRHTLGATLERARVELPIKYLTRTVMVVLLSVGAVAGVASAQERSPSIIAPDGRYLGAVNRNEADPSSVANMR